jgi:hypothetical protein
MGLDSRMLPQSVKENPRVTGLNVQNVKYTDFLRKWLDVMKQCYESIFLTSTLAHHTAISNMTS